MNIAVIGAKGKLGSTIVDELLIQKHNPIPLDKEDKIKEINFSSCEAVIDASHHKNSINVAKICRNYKIPLLIACTGHTEREIKKIKQICNKIRHEICPNLSHGINQIIEFIKQIPSDINYISSIYEQHNKTKIDSPSGTALWLQKILDANNKTQTEIVSSRFSNSIGTHTITLEFDDEIIQISHQVKSRIPFAKGAVRKIENLVNCQVLPGVMSDITDKNYAQS